MIIFHSTYGALFGGIFYTIWYNFYQFASSSIEKLESNVAPHNEGIMKSSAAPNSYVKALTRIQSHAENKDYFMIFIFLISGAAKILTKSCQVS